MGQGCQCCEAKQAVTYVDEAHGFPDVIKVPHWCSRRVTLSSDGDMVRTPIVSEISEWLHFSEDDATVLEEAFANSETRESLQVLLGREQTAHNVNFAMMSMTKLPRDFEESFDLLRVTEGPPYSFGSIDGLLRYMEDTSVRFVRKEYLLSCSRIPRCQDIPDDAFLTKEELWRALRYKAMSRSGHVIQKRKDLWQSQLLVLSHGWLSKDHPDPDCHHLNQLRQYFRRMDDHQAGNSATWQWKIAGLFIDYCCLPQLPRTARQDKLFRLALNDLQVLYGHDFTIVLRLETVPTVTGGTSTPYAKRGWCVTEKAVASTKNTDLHYQLFALTHEDPTGEQLWRGGYHESECSDKIIPLIPERMNEFITSLTFTSKKTDLPKVLNMYKNVFDQRIRRGSVFRWQVSQRNLADFSQLLPYCAGLEILDLSCGTTDVDAGDLVGDLSLLVPIAQRSRRVIVLSLIGIQNLGKCSALATILAILVSDERYEQVPAHLFESIESFANDASGLSGEHDPTTMEQLKALSAYQRPGFFCPYEGTTCFGAFGCILLANGCRIQVDTVRKGHLVWTPVGSAEILCVVRTRCADGWRILCHVGESHAPVTVNHPIRLASDWCLPQDLVSPSISSCPHIYNFVLSRGHIVDIDGIECITLGHGFSDSILAHPYLGTDAVVDDFRRDPGWKHGLIFKEPSQAEETLAAAYRILGYRHQAYAVNSIASSILPTPVQPGLLQQLHAAVMAPLGLTSSYRSKRVRVAAVGTQHIPPPSPIVADLVELFAIATQKGVDAGCDAIDLAAFTVWWVGFVHPFENGNGRAGRGLATVVAAVTSSKTNKINKFDAADMLARLHLAFHSDWRLELCLALQAVNELAAMCPCCGGLPWTVKPSTVPDISISSALAAVLRKVGV